MTYRRLIAPVALVAAVAGLAGWTITQSTVASDGQDHGSGDSKAIEFRAPAGHLSLPGDVRAMATHPPALNFFRVSRSCLPGRRTEMSDAHSDLSPTAGPCAGPMRSRCEPRKFASRAEPGFSHHHSAV